MRLIPSSKAIPAGSLLYKGHALYWVEQSRAHLRDLDLHLVFITHKAFVAEKWDVCLFHRAKCFFVLTGLFCPQFRTTPPNRLYGLSTWWHVALKQFLTLYSNRSVNITGIPCKNVSEALLALNWHQFSYVYLSCLHGETIRNMQCLWFNEEIAVIFNNYHVNPSFQNSWFAFYNAKSSKKQKKTKTIKLEESTGIKIEKGKL